MRFAVKMMSGLVSTISRINAKLRKWTRAPRHLTKKPVMATVAFLLGWFYHGWMIVVWRTSRVDVSGMQGLERALGDRRGAVVALFHETILIGPYVVRKYKPITIVNPSESGNLIVGLLRRMGFTTVRGGSSRGASRRKDVLHQLAADFDRQRDRPVFIAVDGSFGPVRVVKPGVTALARRVDAPLFVFYAASRPVLRFASWDHTRVPLPFSRLVVRMCGPFEPREHGRRVCGEALHRRVQAELNRLAQEIGGDEPTVDTSA